MKLPLQSLVEKLLYVLLISVLGFNIYVAYQTQDVLHDGREANIHRQNETNAYIKCILLLRYDHPELNEKSTREEVVTALDKCADKG